MHLTFPVHANAYQSAADRNHHLQEALLSLSHMLLAAGQAQQLTLAFFLQVRMGLQVLEREKAVFQVNPQSQPDLSEYSYCIERQLKPESRTDIKALLNDLDVEPTSMIDVSDGLSSELIHISKASKLGCQIYEDKLPIDPEVVKTCEEFKINNTTAALNGGEDYELLMTISQKDFPNIKGNPHLTVIGYITEQSSGMHLVTRGDTKIPIKAQGWNAINRYE